MAILTTKDTTPAIIGDKTYKFYPVVNPDQPSDRDFIDTLNLPLAYLTGYGADFDGDMMSIIGVYTDEANADAQRHTMDKKNILTNTSENIRVAQRDFVQTYYALTKRPNMDDAPKFNNLSRVANF
jgi:DNA-directed RNA polymerase beta' subunit